MKNFCFIILLCLMPMTFAATLTATLDRNTVNKGDTVNLTLKYTGNTSQHPDFSGLSKQFMIFGTAKSEQYQNINGKGSTTLQWTVTLYPEAIGKLTIPALSLEQQTTSPITLTVKKAAPKQQKKSNTPSQLYLSTQVSTQAPFAQAQVLYTAKVFSAVNLSQASLTPPQVNGASLLKLGDDKSYQKEEHGQLYEVLERRYAIFPDKPGKLTIQSPVLQGFVREASNNPAVFMPPLRPVTVSTAEKTLTVKALPQKAEIPASKVTLTQHWGHPLSHVVSGTPITRTLTLTAEGMPAEDLPAFETPAIDNVNIYPDKPQLDNALTATGIIGTRHQKIVYMPTAAGHLQLPAIDIAWWDVNTHTLKHTRLPTATLNVQADHPAHPVIKPLRTAPVSAGNVVKIDRKTQLIIALCALWVFTLMLWWWTSRKSSANISPSEHKARVKKACYQKDVRATKVALLAWANAVLTDKRYTQLGDVAKAIADEGMTKAIESLEAALYSKTSQDWSGRDFWGVFQKVKLVKKGGDKTAGGLPPLY